MEQVATHGTRWGNWQYDADRLVLEYKGKDGMYEIDLETCNDSWSILDWILQIASKNWASPEDIGNLVLAFEGVVGYGLQGMIYPDANFNMEAHLKGKS